MSSLDWKKKTWAYSFLQSNAHHGATEIVSWLQSVGVIPSTVKWRRAPKSIYNGLDRNALPAQALAELAYEFDSEGKASPIDFLDWLEFELKGSLKRESYLMTLSSLGRGK